MKKIVITILLIASGTLTSMKAKPPESKEYNFVIFGVPQYIVSNGLRIDFDIHKKNSSRWLILSPYYYFDRSSVDLLNLGGSNDDYDPYSYDQMMGTGLGIAQKIFLSKEPVSHGYYLHYGITYKYFHIDGNNYTWIEYTGEDGLPYQHMQDIEYNMNIHSVAASANLGYQYQIMPALYLDLFIGFGVKYAFHYSPEHVTVKYNRGINDLGYIGTHMTGGIRIGIGL
jgi:hypothetical protein